MARGIWTSVGGDVDLDVITAGAGDVLDGKTIVDKEGEPIKGTMSNNGVQNGALNCGQSKVIPTGYTSGGIVTANSLASQTSATASAATIKSGYTAWVNGSRLTGTMPDYSYLAAGQVSF